MYTVTSSWSKGSYTDFFFVMCTRAVKYVQESTAMCQCHLHVRSTLFFLATANHRNYSSYLKF